MNGQRSTHDIAGRCLADLLGMELDGGKSLGIECLQCVRPHDRFLGPGKRCQTALTAFYPQRVDVHHEADGRRLVIGSVD
ncbi:Uncharacterised protein [Mycobacteroides abscessus subsp. abscessus]|nr:Uncharacterised protein [Mycobacteroides abscessus subsp. abscessus]SIM75324.1 Uncharacterised protein [Mycobacteroides abscessus subsp. abscessus]